MFVPAIDRLQLAIAVNTLQLEDRYMEIIQKQLEDLLDDCRKSHHDRPHDEK